MTELAQVNRCRLWVACVLLASIGWGCSSDLSVDDGWIDAANDSGQTDISVLGDAASPVDASRDTATSDVPGGSSLDDVGQLDATSPPADAQDATAADTGGSNRGPDPREAEMTYVTANIGRNYATKSDVQAVFDKIGDIIGLRGRRDYWRRAWGVLEAEVAREHDRGRNVFVTGDLNRPRRTTNCNPAWNPTSLHRRANGNKKKGSIHLEIDGHEAHWVRGRFLEK